MRPGTRVEFLGFGRHDAWSRLQVGTKGTVRLVDDAGTVHVDWDDGSKLGLVQKPFAGEAEFAPDRFRVVMLGPNGVGEQ